MNPPTVKGFKPYGPEVAGNKKEAIGLLFEEYEALKLCDYDMKNHSDAAKIMCISRPTFTRIYSSARQKIAKAFVEGRQIIIEGGKVYFDSSWHLCNSCGCYFNIPGKEEKTNKCPLCGSEWTQRYQDEPTTTNIEQAYESCNNINR